MTEPPASQDTREPLTDDEWFLSLSAIEKRRIRDRSADPPVGAGDAEAATIERMARAIAEDDERESWDGLWENQAEQDAAGQERGEPNRDDYRSNARAALAAVPKSELEVVKDNES